VTGITMFDAISDTQFPPDAAAYAAYVDGDLADQPNYSYIVSAFPKARHLSITLFPDKDADALDVESGAAMAADIPAWFARQRARGIARPVIYAGAYAMATAVVPVVQSLPGARSSVRLWSAHYGAGEHICGPKSCGETSIDMDGTQWTENAMGRDLDQSLLLENFFAPPAPPRPPADWVFGPVRDLAVVSTGPSSVKLSWVSPQAPMPEAVSYYQVTVRCAGKDIASYPRIDLKGANPEVWQGGSLKAATAYRALVRAVAADGGHASPWATVSFATPAA
jgi:hypothetical protein